MKGHEFFAELAKNTRFQRMTPPMAAFLRKYLAHEKVSRWRDQLIINTHFPPYPGQPFDRMMERFDNDAQHPLFLPGTPGLERFRVRHVEAGEKSASVKLQHAPMIALPGELQQVVQVDTYPPAPIDADPFAR